MPRLRHIRSGAVVSVSAERAATLRGLPEWEPADTGSRTAPEAEVAPPPPPATAPKPPVKKTARRGRREE